MKFIIDSAKLLGVVMTVGKAIGNNPVLPIVECLLFQITGKELTVTCTDLEITIIQKTEIQSAEKDGIIAIPYKILQETLKALPQQPIQFEINDTFGITIKSAQGKYKMVGDDPKDFPNLPEREDVKEIQLKDGVLSKVISHTGFALSNDELRPSMTGLYVSVGNALEFVSTDAHKLARVRLKSDAEVEEGHFIIPKKGLNAMKDVRGDLVITYNKSNVFFQTEDIQVICRLIDARYPDYNAIIPTDNPQRLVVNAEGCKQALKRIAIYSNKTTRQVVFNIQNEALDIQAEDLDFECSAKESMLAEYEGEQIRIGFNAKYLLESIIALGTTEEFVFHLSSPSRAALLKPYSKEDNMDVTVLVMPVMLSA